MSVRLLAAAALALGLVVLALGSSWAPPRGSDSAPPVDQTASRTTGAAGSERGIAEGLPGLPDPRSTAPAASPAAPSSTAAPVIEGATEIDGDRGGRRGTTTLPGLGRVAKPEVPLLSGPLPQAGHATRALVAGYPRRVVPVVPGSRVLTSSLSPAGDVLQVALVAQTRRSAERVLRFYRIRFTAQGLPEVPVPAAGGDRAVGFRGLAGSVVVTVTPGDPTYRVLATLRARAA